MKKENQPILIMAAGTGGHLFPALAIAKALQSQGNAIAWLGSQRPMERRIVEQAGLPFQAVAVKGLRGGGFKRYLFAPFMLIMAFCHSLYLIFKIKPAVVIGMGGYVCGPGGIAAWLLRKPLFLHEQNSVPGITNRLLKPFARKIFTAFPNVLTSNKTEIVGNPIRSEILNIAEPKSRFEARDDKPLHVLVFGGSLGAQLFNERLPEFFHYVLGDQPVEVWHQSGEQYLTFSRRNYQAFHVPAKVEPFIDNMAKAYEWADLIICRSGAMTVSEIAAVGVPAIFVPYPFHKDQQQVYNARFLVDQEAALMIEQKDFTADHLKEKVLPLLNRKILLEMALKARALRRDDAVEKIITEVGKAYASN